MAGRKPLKDPRHRLGAAGEELAEKELRRQGYRILERNFTSPLGEVDLIARHRGTLVFVEVKTRKQSRYGAPQEAVSPAKQARLRRLADYYLRAKGLKDQAVRFDVVAITFQDDAPRIEIIVNAIVDV
ncbi:MAG: YraN family protein [Deltaproteobacteria bacterium]|nr:YraN family protein [Deltaproteobacteria bacterium]